MIIYLHTIHTYMYLSKHSYTPSRHMLLFFIEFQYHLRLTALTESERFLKNAVTFDF